MSAYKYKTVKRVCEICNIQFDACISLVNRGHGKTCSLKCARKKAKPPSGKKHRLFKGGAAQRKKNIKEYREKYPERYKARQMVSYAKRIKKLTPMPCVVCGLEKVEAHHEDYTKPLDVVWLCKSHHREADKKLVLRTGDFK